MKKSGFTLIELLAVIIILSIIAIIATTKILGIVEEAKIGAFKDSVLNVINSADLHSEIKDKDIKKGINILDINLNNSDLKYGKVQLINNKLVAVNISNGNYCANGEVGSLIIAKGECDTIKPKAPKVELPTSYAKKATYLISEDDETESGIKHFEYYITNDDSDIESISTVTGISKVNEITITEESNKVCFRIVAQSGKVGYWSCVTNKVDLTPPSINIVDESGKLKSYTIEDKSAFLYQITTNQIEPEEWNTISETSYNSTFESTTIGTYYIYAKDESGNISHKSFKIYHYYETLLNGADPDLGVNMVPVLISSTGVVTYADMFDKWYKYENKEWANIVILNDGYSYNEGDIIPEVAIESYFVWIPRYRYKLIDLGNYSTASTSALPSNYEKTFEIVFETKNNATLDSNSGECTTPMLSNATGNCKVSDWMTHPAFISFDANGIWVGKFELGYRGSTSYSGGNKESASVSMAVVKPNVSSWRYNGISNLFYVEYNYDRSNDSHMMKNTEWGSVAILTKSIYGKNSEVWNNPYVITGCAGASSASYNESTCVNSYITTQGKQATTTGNITGIYDMAGGAGEYMASKSQNLYGESGLSAATFENVYNSKYYDIYYMPIGVVTSKTLYSYRILGDATGELGPFYYNVGNCTWYKDYAYFVNGDTQYKTTTWFLRGGLYNVGEGSGEMSFETGAGSKEVYKGSRLVLIG